MIRSIDRVSWLLLVCLLGMLVAHAAYYWPFLSDDALISLSYARQLANGDGLTWTTGERVEGYTDLLWVLLMAPACKAFGDCIPGARLLAFLGVAAAIVLVGWSVRSRRFQAERWVSGGALLVLSAPLAVWSIGGLEHGLMAGVLMAAFLLVERAAHAEPRGREPWTAGASLAALALLRADGVVLVSGLLLGALFVPKPSKRSLGRVILIGCVPLAALLTQLAFRRFYYGEWQPNTAAAKVAFNWHRLELGFAHLRQGYLALAVAFAVAAWATHVLRRRGSGKAAIPGWTMIAVWSLYLLVVGGDIFPGWRQLVFVVVALAVIVSRAAEEAKLSVRAMLPYAVLAGAAHVGLQLRDSENRRADSEMWEWDGLSIGTLLKKAFGDKRPLLAVDAAGALPYWSELPSIDMLGLNDRFIAHHPPHNFGFGPIGHELGHGAYVLRRAPDLIAFNSAAGSRDPLFLSGRQMLEQPEFHERYQWIRVRGSIGNRATGEIWVRREGGKLGVVRSADRIAVPGYFFSGQASDAVAELDARGRLVTVVTSSRPGVLPALSVPAGRYRLETVPTAPELALRCNDVSAERLRDGATTIVELELPTQLGIALAPARGTLELASVQLIQTHEAPTHRCLARGTRLRVAPSELRHRQAENTFWAHPRNVLFGPAGLAISLGGPTNVLQVELSLDNNDEYEVEGLLAGVRAFRRVLEPRNNGGGLAIHRWELPRETAVDELLIRARGDGFFSVGHVALAP